MKNYSRRQKAEGKYFSPVTCHLSPVITTRLLCLTARYANSNP
ncbi:MAG: hypothetical protein ACKPE3_03020 [Sphaerospermopsis kisseleviana]